MVSLSGVPVTQPRVHPYFCYRSQKQRNVHIFIAIRGSQHSEEEIVAIPYSFQQHSLAEDCWLTVLQQLHQSVTHSIVDALWVDELTVKLVQLKDPARVPQERR